MSEPKRVPLSSIQTNKTKKVKSIKKSLRFNLTLTESNEESCPIFSYKELVEAAVKTTKPTLNGLDAFADDVDEAEIQRLAKQYEAKYGGNTITPSAKKKKKKYKGDWADVGAGYDETDSFIDNTDAYDEIVPEDISPEHGGFYINSGALEFKQQELYDIEDVRPSLKNKKRQIDDSDDDNNIIEKTNKTNDEKRVKIDSERSAVTTSTSTISTKKIENGINSCIKKKIDENGVNSCGGNNSNNNNKSKSITVKELLKEKRDEVVELVNSDINNKQPKDNNNDKTGLSSTSINDAIESVIQQNTNLVNYDESSKDSVSSVTSTIQSTGGSVCSYDDTNSDNDENNENHRTKDKFLQLPDNLSDELVQLINHLKLISQTADHKTNFFSAPVNSMLIRLYDLTSSLRRNIKSQIFEYLASLIKRKKDTLIRRTKKLVFNSHQKKINSSISRLKEIIEKTMPIVIENYNRECDKVNEKKFYPERSDISASDKMKLIRSPKRKYVWDDESRQLLNEIVTVKQKCFLMERTKDTPELDQYMELFFKEHLINLWPDGWITVKSLMRECTSLDLKDSKLNKRVEMNQKSQSSTSTNHIALSDKLNTTKLVGASNESTTTTTDLSVKLSMPAGISVSIKPISHNDTTTSSSVKNPPPITSGGLTIEAIPPNKLKATDLTVNNLKHNSRNNSPTPIEMKTKSINDKKIKCETSSAAAAISVRKLSELQSNPNEINTTALASLTSNPSIVLTKNASTKHDDNDSDVEIIEIKDDTPPIDKHKYKKKLSFQKEKAAILSKIMKEKQIKESPVVKTNSIPNTTTKKSSVDDDDKVISDPEDVLLVIKNLRELEELSSNKKSHHSPVSVIAVNNINNRQSTSAPVTTAVSTGASPPLASSSSSSSAVNNNKNHSVSSTLKCSSGSGNENNMGFQDAFQKHLFQDSLDCKNTAANSFSASSQGKLKINSNSIDIFPFFGSTNSTTIVVPISTSTTKYPSQNLTINAAATNTNLSSIQPPLSTQNSGPAQKSPPH